MAETPTATPVEKKVDVFVSGWGDALEEELIRAYSFGSWTTVAMMMCIQSYAELVREDDHYKLWRVFSQETIDRCWDGLLKNAYYVGESWKSWMPRDVIQSKCSRLSIAGKDVKIVPGTHYPENMKSLAAYVESRVTGTPSGFSFAA